MAHVNPYLLVTAESDDPQDAIHEAESWIDGQFENGNAQQCGIDYGKVSDDVSPIRGGTEQFRAILKEIEAEERKDIAKAWRSVRDGFAKVGEAPPDYDSVRMLLHEAEGLRDLMANRYYRESGDPGIMGTEVKLYDGREDLSGSPMEKDAWLVRLDFHY